MSDLSTPHPYRCPQCAEPKHPYDMSYCVQCGDPICVACKLADNICAVCEEWQDELVADKGEEEQ